MIPKSVNEGRLVENHNVWDFELSQEDMAAMATLATGKSLFSTPAIRKPPSD